MKSTALKNAEEEVIIRRIIDGLELPDTVKEYRVSLRADHAGDPGAYILFLMDDALDEKAFLTEARKVDNLVAFTLLDSPETEYWPYINFRSAHEQVRLDRTHPGVNW